MEKPDGTVVIGAGIGGLCAALRLAHAGHPVTVLDSHAAPGGKMRTRPSVAGPVDAGPTVLTMRPVFERLFADVGEVLADHVTLYPLTTLARHYWSDGTRLDLFADPDASAAEIARVFGHRSEAEFRAFHARTARLFDAFEAPVMQVAAPSRLAVAARVLRQPRLIADMAPGASLATLLRRSFTEPRLRQLFGRYATYVGGRPDAAPALLSLIWQAEARGVWCVDGGMQALARAIADLAARRGAVFHADTTATRIELNEGRIVAVRSDRDRFPAGTVLYNGDPAALRAGHFGVSFRDCVPRAATEPHSLSAHVMAFAATATGLPLAHHTVLFADDPASEWADLAAGRCPADPSIYICAQDRIAEAPTGPERFEIIVNAPPLPHATPQDADTCRKSIHHRLKTSGLTLTPFPGRGTMTTPQDFAEAFPASAGSIYGRSPHGMTAAFARPTARTAYPGLYLCGGGAHPGAGVPMAALSGRHAAEAIWADRASTSTSRRGATPGGMSTGSRTAAPAPSRSSVS